MAGKYYSNKGENSDEEGYAVSHNLQDIVWHNQCWSVGESHLQGGSFL